MLTYYSRTSPLLFCWKAFFFSCSNSPHRVSMSFLSTKMIGFQRLTAWDNPGIDRHPLQGWGSNSIPSESQKSLPAAAVWYPTLPFVCDPTFKKSAILNEWIIWRFGITNLFRLFSYFHKIPEEAPGLEQKATHGLASPQEFTLPAAHAMWAGDAYAGFDASKARPQNSVSRLTYARK